MEDPKEAGVCIQDINISNPREKKQKSKHGSVLSVRRRNRIVGRPPSSSCTMDHEELYYRAMEEVVRLEGSPQQKVALLGELLWRSIRQYIDYKKRDGEQSLKKVAALEQEAQVWCLVKHLFRVPTYSPAIEEEISAETMSIPLKIWCYRNRVDGAESPALMTDNLSPPRLQRIVDWQEELAEEEVKKQQGVPMSETVSADKIYETRVPDCLTEDPDEELVANEDKLKDGRDLWLLVRVWMFIRAGHKDEAIKLCSMARQPWRAASLFGNELDALETMSIEDIVKSNARLFCAQVGQSRQQARSLQRYSAFQLSRHSVAKAQASVSNRELEQLEAAIYGYQSFFLGGIQPVCRSRDDSLWASVHCLLGYIIDEKLATESTVASGDGEEAQLWPAKLIRDQFSPENTLETLIRRIPNEHRQQQQQSSLFQDVQNCLILGNWKELIRKLKYSSENVYLRFQSHLMWALQLLQKDLDEILSEELETKSLTSKSALLESQVLLRAYAMSLCDSPRGLRLLSLYASQNHNPQFREHVYVESLMSRHVDLPFDEKRELMMDMRRSLENRPGDPRGGPERITRKAFFKIRSKGASSSRVALSWILADPELYGKPSYINLILRELALQPQGQLIAIDMLDKEIRYFLAESSAELAEKKSSALYELEHWEYYFDLIRQMMEFDQLVDSLDSSSPRLRELGLSISEKISQVFSDQVLFLYIDGDEENDLAGCDIQAFQLIESDLLDIKGITREEWDITVVMNNPRNDTVDESDKSDDANEWLKSQGYSGNVSLRVRGVGDQLLYSLKSNEAATTLSTPDQGLEELVAAIITRAIPLVPDGATFSRMTTWRDDLARGVCRQVLYSTLLQKALEIDAIMVEKLDSERSEIGLRVPFIATRFDDMVERTMNTNNLKDLLRSECLVQLSCQRSSAARTSM